MQEIKTFCFHNSTLMGETYDAFQDNFSVSHHMVTGKYHNGKAGIDFVNDLTTGQLTNLVISNAHLSGVYQPGDYLFGIRDKHNRTWTVVEGEKQTIYYNTNYKRKLRYEECVGIINHEIEKRRGKWRLTAVQWMDYDDISQILRLHIYKKFHMWDQSRAIEPWLNVLIGNQISNLLRNNYGNYSRPCLKCSANDGGDLCALYGTQCSNCPLYAKWMRTKKRAYDSKLPLPLENHIQEVHEKPNMDFDIAKGTINLKTRMKQVLKPVEYRVYDYLYVKGGREEGLAKLLGFRTSEQGKAAGYRQIRNIKDAIIKKAKEAIYNHEVDF